MTIVIGADDHFLITFPVPFPSCSWFPSSILYSLILSYPSPSSSLPFIFDIILTVIHICSLFTFTHVICHQMFPFSSVLWQFLQGWWYYFSVSLFWFPFVCIFPHTSHPLPITSVDCLPNFRFSFWVFPLLTLCWCVIVIIIGCWCWYCRFPPCFLLYFWVDWFHGGIVLHLHWVDFCYWLTTMITISSIVSMHLLCSLNFIRRKLVFWCHGCICWFLRTYYAVIYAFAFIDPVCSCSYWH